MNELQKKVIEEMELNHGWSNMVDDESIGMKLFKDTVTATEKVVKNLTLADVMPRFIPIESCMKCPNKFPTFSNVYRCTIKPGIHPLPEDGSIHKDCPLPPNNEA